MSALIESEKLDDPEFKWTKKRRTGGKNKNVQFYESFTYDGVDYAMHDCVYMYKQGEPAPYIGKLVKIWEFGKGVKKIKVQWFFRPSEISYYLKDAKVLENELFFASGAGIGLADLNPLEAIAGKCNVVCTSVDSRNPQPSAEELQLADYVFYRIFDVKSCTISDQMDDKVGGLDVNFVFNKRESVGKLDGPKIDSGETYEARNVVACKETLKIAGNSSPQRLNNMKLDKNGNHTLEEDTKVTQVPLKQGSLVEKHSSGVDAISSRNREITGTTFEERSTMCAKYVESNICEKKDKSKDISPVSQVQIEKGAKYVRKSCDIDDAPSKRAKFDGSVSSDSNGVQGLSVARNDEAHLLTGATTSNIKLKSELVKDSVGCSKDVKLTENLGPLDEKLSKTGFSLSKEESRSGHAEDADGLHKNSKSNGNSNDLQGKLPKMKAFSSREKENSGSAHRKDSFVAEKDKTLGGNLSSCGEKLDETNAVEKSGSAHRKVFAEKDKKLGGNLRSSGEKSSKTNVVSRDETQRPSTTNVLPDETPKSVPNKESEGSRQAAKPIQILSTSMKRPVEISAEDSKEKSNLGHDKYRENKVGSGQAAKPVQSLSTSIKRPLEISAEECKKKPNLGLDKSRERENKLASNSYPKDGEYLKKAKLDNSIKQTEENKNNTVKNLKEKNSLGETKNSPKCAASGDNNAKSRLGEGTSKEHLNEKAIINVGETKKSPKFVTRENKAKSKLGEGPSKEHHYKKDDNLLKDNLPNPFTTKPKDDDWKVGGQIIEVTPKPPVKRTWIKFTWDEQMKTAHDQGKLVLLQNLDPGYTSGEVEDIIWHIFGENCPARMVPHTAVSNPYSGQAFVVFKSRDAADKVVQKLNDGCLMLPNRRPLVACHGVLPNIFEKQTTFVGHLAIDKARRQMQRDTKDAVCTSHYSQPNTIEFEMAMDWCLLQSKSDKWWASLHELQRKELKKLMENLKSK